MYNNRYRSLTPLKNRMRSSLYDSKYNNEDTALSLDRDSDLYDIPSYLRSTEPRRYTSSSPKRYDFDSFIKTPLRSNFRAEPDVSLSNSPMPKRSSILNNIVSPYRHNTAHHEDVLDTIKRNLDFKDDIDDTLREHRIRDRHISTSSAKPDDLSFGLFNSTSGEPYLPSESCRNHYSRTPDDPVRRRTTFDGLASDVRGYKDESVGGEPYYRNDAPIEGRKYLFDRTADWRRSSTDTALDPGTRDRCVGRIGDTLERGKDTWIDYPSDDHIGDVTNRTLLDDEDEYRYNSISRRIENAKRIHDSSILSNIGDVRKRRIIDVDVGTPSRKNLDIDALIERAKQQKLKLLALSNT